MFRDFIDGFKRGYRRAEPRFTQRQVSNFCDYGFTLVFALIGGAIIWAFDGYWWMIVLLAHFDTATWYARRDRS